MLCPTSPQQVLLCPLTGHLFAKYELNYFQSTDIEHHSTATTLLSVHDHLKNAVSLTSHMSYYSGLIRGVRISPYFSIPLPHWSSTLHIIHYPS